MHALRQRLYRMRRKKVTHHVCSDFGERGEGGADDNACVRGADAMRAVRTDWCRRRKTDDRRDSATRQDRDRGAGSGRDRSSLLKHMRE
jgi:hypothetical protein